MNKTTLNKFLEIAKELLIKDGKLMPIAFLELENKEEMIIGIPHMPNIQM